MTTEPTLVEILRVAAENRELDLFTSFVGKVEKFSQGPPPVVDVLPVIKRPLQTKTGEIVHEELPVVPNIPVTFLQAKNFSMSWEIEKGDHVLCVCTNWSHQAWRESGDMSEPGDLRTHEIGNAFAIAGVIPKSGSIPFVSGAVLVEVDGTHTTHLQVGSGSAEAVSRDDKVQQRLGELFAAINGATPTPNDGGAALKTAIIGTLTGNGWGPTGTSPNTSATKLKSE